MRPEDRTRLGEKIRNYCGSEWDISLEVARHEKLYLEMVGHV